MSQLAIDHPEQPLVDYSYQICPNRRATQIKACSDSSAFHFKAGLVLPVNLDTKHQQIGDIFQPSLALDPFSARASQIAGVGFFLGFFASLFFFC